MSIKFQHKEIYCKKLEKLIESGCSLIEEALKRDGINKEADFRGWTSDPIYEMDQLFKPNQLEELDRKILIWQKQCLNLCQKLALEETGYYELAGFLKRDDLQGIDIQIAVANLEAILKDLKDGLFENIFLKLEIESVLNHLEQAYELFDEGEYGIAGIIALCSFEAFLKEMSKELVVPDGVNLDKNEKPKRQPTMERIANHLRNRGVLDKVTHKEVKKWSGIRDDLVHGNFKNADRSEIEKILIEIKAFVSSRM